MGKGSQQEKEKRGRQNGDEIHKKARRLTQERVEGTRSLRGLAQINFSDAHATDEAVSDLPIFGRNTGKPRTEVALNIPLRSAIGRTHFRVKGQDGARDDSRLPCYPL